MRLTIKIKTNIKGGYTAMCPSLPGCMSCGETRDEAQKKLDEAIRGYVAALNNSVPDTMENEFVEV